MIEAFQVNKVWGKPLANLGTEFKPPERESLHLSGALCAEVWGGSLGKIKLRVKNVKERGPEVLLKISRGRGLGWGT